MTATWSGFFPSGPADRTRHRVSLKRPCVTSSNAHTLWRTPVISRLFTLQPNTGQRCARATVHGSTACPWIPREPCKHDSNRSNCARCRTTVLPQSLSDPASQIRSWLAEAEAGRWQAWWQLTYYLMLTPESRAFGERTRLFRHRHAGMGRG